MPLAKLTEHIPCFSIITRDWILKYNTTQIIIPRHQDPSIIKLQRAARGSRFAHALICNTGQGCGSDQLTLYRTGTITQVHILKAKVAGKLGLTCRYAPFPFMKIQYEKHHFMSSFIIVLSSDSFAIPLTN